MNRPTDAIDISIDLVDEVYLLSTRQRQAVVFYSLGMTQKEIAQDMGITQAAVSQLILCGMKRIRENAIYLLVQEVI